MKSVTPSPRLRSDPPWLVLQTLGAIGLFLLGVGMLSVLFRAELEGLGRAFVARFGLLGMFVGTWLADALSLPLPPQFYLLAAHLSGARPAPVLVCVSLASVLGGHSGYHLAARLGVHTLLRGRLRRAQQRVAALFVRYGVRAVAVGSVLPVPFSVLCYAAACCRVPYGLFTLLTLLRIPRILFYYFLITLGWR
ncbi:MAG: VTT domain-containing protein [Myxococcales bacterium]|nr:VTT domain-containing protein [Myxococcota bacterium]MDW8283256.1 VTT domain-containing protein [Myxococcales bacterium]